MRIEKREVVYFSQNENDTWFEFGNLLLHLLEETENPDTEKMIKKIRGLLNDLWEDMEVETE